MKQASRSAAMRRLVVPVLLAVVLAPAAAQASPAGRWAAGRQGTPTRHDEPHSVHALPPSLSDAPRARPPELRYPLPRVKACGTKS